MPKVCQNTEFLLCFQLYVGSEGCGWWYWEVNGQHGWFDTLKSRYYGDPVSGSIIVYNPFWKSF
jgi:hypothetical protein